MSIIEDDDILFFCCKHGLSLCQEDYNQFELEEIKKAFLKEQEDDRIKNSLKLKSILNS